MVRKSVVLSSLHERVTMIHGIRIVIGRFANFCRARFLTRFLHKYVYALVGVVGVHVRVCVSLCASGVWWHCNVHALSLISLHVDDELLNYVRVRVRLCQACGVLA